MKRFLFGAGVLGASALLGLFAFIFLSSDPPAADAPEGPASAARLSGIAFGASPSRPPLQPAVVTEDRGPAQIYQPLRAPEPQSPMVAQPLFETNARIKLGETTNLKFSVRDRATGHAVSGSVISASVKDDINPATPLKVEEVDDGVFEVPFTATGPGQFQIVLSMDGLPVGSGKVGVVGAAGSLDGQTEVAGLPNDPREFAPAFRPRSGRGRSR